MLLSHDGAELQGIVTMLPDAAAVFCLRTLVGPNRGRFLIVKNRPRQLRTVPPEYFTFSAECIRIIPRKNMKKGSCLCKSHKEEPAKVQRRYFNEKGIGIVTGRYNGAQHGSMRRRRLLFVRTCS